MNDSISIYCNLLQTPFNDDKDVNSKLVHNWKENQEAISLIPMKK